MRITMAGVMAATLAALPAGAETFQFSNAIFDLPAGWDHMRTEKTYQILSPGDDMPCDDCYFYIARSQPVLGDLASFVTRSQRQFLDDDGDDRITARGPVEIVHERGHPIAMQMFDLNGDPLLLAGFQIKDRYELVGLRGTGMEPEELDEFQTTFEKTFQNYLLTTRYVSVGAAPLMPPPEPGPLTGAGFAPHAPPLPPAVPLASAPRIARLGAGTKVKPWPITTPMPLHPAFPKSPAPNWKAAAAS